MLQFDLLNFLFDQFNEIILHYLFKSTVPFYYTTPYVQSQFVYSGLHQYIMYDKDTFMYEEENTCVENYIYICKSRTCHIRCTEC